MTKLEEFYSIRLPKWVALIVVGKTVTKEQAAEILARTNNWYLCTNDKTWKNEIYSTFNISIGEEDWKLQMNAIQEFKKTINVLDLYYLHNNRIASPYKERGTDISTLKKTVQLIQNKYKNIVSK